MPSYSYFTMHFTLDRRRTVKIQIAATPGRGQGQQSSRQDRNVKLFIPREALKYLLHGPGLAQQITVFEGPRPSELSLWPHHAGNLVFPRLTRWTAYLPALPTGFSQRRGRERDLFGPRA